MLRESTTRLPERINEGETIMKACELMNKYCVNQLGYVVEDVQEACETFTNAFGAGPFFIMTPPPMAKTIFRGKEVENAIEVAYGMYGDLQIELIKPLTAGPTPYTEKGIGFNHFSVWVDDFDQAVKDWEEAGYEVAMYMESSQGLRVAYIDCLKDLGQYVEIHNPQSFLIDKCKEARDAWDGTSAVVEMKMG